MGGNGAVVTVGADVVVGAEGCVETTFEVSISATSGVEDRSRGINMQLVSIKTLMRLKAIRIFSIITVSQ